MKKGYLFLLFFVVVHYSYGQTIYPIAFYNTENFFDSNSDKPRTTKEFTPDGAKHWTRDRYQKKIKNIAYVISQLGENQNSAGAVVIGLSEIENNAVLNDLVHCKSIANKKYSYIHFKSADKRGIDVALLYNPAYFKPLSAKAYPIKIKNNRSFTTRDELLVTGYLGGEPFAIIVNHWSSRLVSVAAVYREEEALVCKQICDSIHRSNPSMKIIVMGDLNDEPIDKCCRRILVAKKNIKDVSSGDLFNPMWLLSEKGEGTICYQNKWYLFDQLLVSSNLLGNTSKLRFVKAEVFKQPYLLQTNGSKKGQPLATYSGSKFLGGFSDHLPVVLYLSKRK